ncbi:MAG TPA: tetratricopeptide repeat protein [Vicinamibacterales bacterium]|jgi:tetratricopeptide (TPR) repeat protein|nr:tetratricopeptide repeat protein [Vicinamibacterales bacterium]
MKQRSTSKTRPQGAPPAPPLNTTASAARGRTSVATPAAPVRRSTYFEAVSVYERGVEALQRHEYELASELLNSVLRQYPDEKELHERVRLYLKVCDRLTTPRESTPSTVQERLYAATLALNGSRYDEALKHLRLVRDEDPDNDHALYMLAVAHAQRQELAEAIAHLERAIALNPENRAIARQDQDLDPLRDDESFRTALDAAPLAPTDRRRPPVRPRSSR